MYQDDPDYASKRLNTTLVRLLDGSPFLVNKVCANDSNILGTTGTNLLTDEALWVPLSELDLEPVPLGFINLKGNMTFTCRKPMRKDWRQGLSSNSLISYGALLVGEINFKCLVQPIMNQYPSYARALADIPKFTSIAFCRDFGLVRKGGSVSLIFRKYEVGYVDGNRAILNHDKTFLQQHLEEVI